MSRSRIAVVALVSVLIGSMLVKKGEADGMICGTISTTHRHLHFIDHLRHAFHHVVSGEDFAAVAH